jgi:hypothetical protein
MMAIRADLGGGLESQQWIVNAYLLTLGPPVSAGGVLYLIATVDESPGLLLEVLPGTTIFAVGLAIVVAPLTETVLSDAESTMPESRQASTTRSRASRDFSRPPRSAPSPAATWTSAASGWLSPWPRVYSPWGCRRSGGERGDRPVGDDGGDDSGQLSATRTASGAGARSVTAEP